MLFDQTPAGLIALFSMLDKYKQVRWQSYEQDDRREPTDKISDAVCVSSRLNDQPDTSMYLPTDQLGVERHQLLIDLDVQAYLVPSTTPGHTHLYVEVPNGIMWRDLEKLLRALSACGIIETGYAAASIERHSTTLRLPWIVKEHEPKEGDPMKVRFQKIDAQGNWTPRDTEIPETQQRYDAWQFINHHADLVIAYWPETSEGGDVIIVQHAVHGAYLIQSSAGDDALARLLDRFSIVEYLTWVNTKPTTPIPEVSL